MKDLGAFNSHTWKPLQAYGFTHPFFELHPHTIASTWVVLFFLLTLLIIGGIALRRQRNPIKTLTLAFVESFRAIVVQTLGWFSYTHFLFFITLFLFIFACSAISIFPGLEEPTTDLNTTLALGVISFLYVHVNAINSQGLYAYAKGYFAPFFVMFPLNVMGKLANIVSISFRLFGNIFGGSIITKIWLGFISSSWILESIALSSGANLGILAFFGIFEGMIQAFVFSMLTLTYVGIAVKQGED